MTTIGEQITRDAQLLIDLYATEAKSLITPVFNVLGYGAKGDGVKDATQAIMDACKAAGIGGTVYFPKGTYLISSAQGLNHSGLEAMAGQRLIAEPGTVLLRDTPGVILSIHEANGVTVDGFTFRGSYAKTGEGYHLRIRGSTDCQVRNCIFEDAGGDSLHIQHNETTLEKAARILVDGCRFYRAGNIEILTWYADDVVVRNCYFTGTLSTTIAGHAIYVKDGAGFICEGSTFEDVTSAFSGSYPAAVQIAPDDTDHLNFVIANCTFRNVGSGIVLDRCQNGVVSNCAIDLMNGGFHIGVSLYRAVDVVVDGITVRGGYGGIYTAASTEGYGNPENIVVSNVVVRDCSGRAVNITGCTLFKLTDVQVCGVGLFGIRVKDSQHGIISDCHVINPNSGTDVFEQSGFYFDNSQKVTITGCRVTDTRAPKRTKYGIHSYNGSDYLFIYGNYFADFTTAATNLAGSNNTLVDNVLA